METEASQIVPGYNLIILRVAEHNFPSVIQEFAKIFSLEIEPAEQILKSAPIVFLRGLDKNYLRILKENLLTLSKTGIEFMVSTRLSTTIPRVTWPGKQPNYTVSPSGELIKFVDFQWRGNAFVCPNCSETFVFNRMGNPLARYLKVKDETASRVDSAAQAPKITPQTKSIPQKTEEEVVSVDENEVVELPPIADAKESSDAEEFAELTPIEEPSENNPESLEPMDILEEHQESPPVADETSSHEGAESSEPDEIPEESIETAATEELPNCSVFLTFIPPNKKAEAAELIAQMKGVPMKQAQVLTMRLLVPIVKDVTATEANKCMEEFQKIGIKSRVTVKK